MSDSYTKLFSSITESTVWSEPAGTRLVWITMLALVRRDGVVYASLPGLADRAKVTLEETVIALKALSSPDPYSRTKEHEGRRIEEVDGGWLLLNFGKYTNMRSTEERREYMRKLMAEKRKSAKLANVSKVSPTSTITNTREKQKKEQPPMAAFAIPDWIRPEVWLGFAEMRKRKRAPLTARACAMVVTELIKLRDAGNDPNTVLDQSTRNSWTDVYAIKQGEINGNHKPRETMHDRVERKLRAAATTIENGALPLGEDVRDVRAQVGGPVRGSAG